MSFNLYVISGDCTEARVHHAVITYETTLFDLLLDKNHKIGVVYTTQLYDLIHVRTWILSSDEFQRGNLTFLAMNSHVHPLQSDGLYRLQSMDWLRETRPLWTWLGPVQFTCDLLVHLPLRDANPFEMGEHLDKAGKTNVSCLGQQVSVGYIEQVARLLLKRMSQAWVEREHLPFYLDMVTLDILNETPRLTFRTYLLLVSWKL
jgi:hypothetical protein